MPRRLRGFTLVEVLVVLSLLGVLMGLSIGFIQRAGRGNVLMQTSHSLASLLASAREQSYGTNRAYVAIESTPKGTVVLRSYRNRQVFHWPCEDFERASEEGIMTQRGGVEVVDPGAAAREGRYVRFSSGGEVSLGAPPWLQFVDGFSIECRLRVPEKGASSGMVLFRKGNAIRVQLVTADLGSYDVEARLMLQKDEKGEGEGEYLLRSGFREGTEVPEWRGPVLAGRWVEVRVGYDRNTFAVHVNDRLRGIRSDRRNRMRPNDDPFLIGGGFVGDFDSLVIGGIFEDDDDLYEVPQMVTWLDAKGQPRTGAEYIHFRNRMLDPAQHAKPVHMIFGMERGEGEYARRAVDVALSGETFVRDTLE